MVQHGQQPLQKEVLFACQECEFSTKDKKEVKAHTEQEHRQKITQERKFVCHKCEHQAEDKSELKRHIETKHSKINQYKCTFCDFVSGIIVDLQSNTAQCHVDMTGAKGKKLSPKEGTQKK